MRRVVVVALLAAGLSMRPVKAQNSSEQPAGKPQSKPAESRPKHNDWLFEGGPEPKNGAAWRAPTHHRAEAEPAPESVPATPVPPPPAPVLPTVQAAPPGPPQKNLTGEEFAHIHVGSTQKEVLSVLGPPSSRVAVPDDDGHLRESFQYWVKGNPMATVRLDNGRVVQIETRQK